MKHRRDFLKLFGYSAAVVPALATGEPETVRTTPPAPALHDIEGSRDLFAAYLDHALAVDVCDGFLYSGVEIERNTMQSRYTLFCDYPLNEWPKTNMCMPGQLPQPQAFAVERMGVCFSKNMPARLAWAFCDRYSMHFRLGQKIYAERCLAAVSTFGVVGALAEDLTIASYPSAIKSPLESLSVPIIIPPGHHFSVELYGEPMAVHGKIRLWAFLQGRRMRPVQ